MKQKRTFVFFSRGLIKKRAFAKNFEQYEVIIKNYVDKNGSSKVTCICIAEGTAMATRRLAVSRKAYSLFLNVATIGEADEGSVSVEIYAQKLTHSYASSCSAYTLTTVKANEAAATV